MINPNWTKWIRSSIATYFDSEKGANVLFITGERNTEKLASWTELNFDGPSFHQITKREYSCRIGIMLMCNIRSATNIYSLSSLSGFFESKIKDIPISNNLGCLVQHGPIVKINWGMIDAIQREAIEVEYQMTILGD